MTRMFVALLALVIATSACGRGSFSATLPTAPTATAPIASARVEVVVPPSTTTQIVVNGLTLNWERAESCPLQKPALASAFFGGTPPSIKEWSVRGEVWGLWPDPDHPSGEKCLDLEPDESGNRYSEVVTEYNFVAAIFIQGGGGQWQYCGWDHAGTTQHAYNRGACQR